MIKKKRKKAYKSSEVRTVTLPLLTDNDEFVFKDHIQTTYPSTKDDILRLAKLVPKNSGLTIDTGHLLHDIVDVIEVLKQTHKSVLNIHLHDGKKGSAHLKLGDGDLNLQEFFSFLQKINYDGFVSLEVMGKKEIKESWITATKYSNIS